MYRNRKEKNRFHKQTLQLGEIKHEVIEKKINNLNNLLKNLNENLLKRKTLKND